jgi:hypothetical protein
MSAEQAKKFMEDIVSNKTLLKSILKNIKVDWDSFLDMATTGFIKRAINPKKRDEFIEFINDVNEYDCTKEELEKLYKSKAIKQSKDTEIFWKAFFTKYSLS